MRKDNIGVQVHYIPIHLQPYYKKKYGKLELKEAEKFYKNCLTLPLFHELKMMRITLNNYNFIFIFH